MAIIEVSKQQIKDVKAALRESLKADDIPQRYTTKELVEIYFKEIEQLVRRFNLSHAVNVLDAQGISISANTLKQYMSEIRKEKKAKASTTTLNSSSEANRYIEVDIKTETSAPTQVLIQKDIDTETSSRTEVDTPAEIEVSTSMEAEENTTVETETDTKPMLPGRRSRSRARPMY